MTAPARYPDPPQTASAFHRAFGTEEACADYLFQLRYPQGYECPKCGSTRAYRVSDTPGMVQCPNHHKVSVTAGTALHRTKMPLTLWFQAAWHIATMKPGISAVQFQRQVGIKRLDTAWAMLHKLRAGLVSPVREKLSSKCNDETHSQHWIEVDEVIVGGRNRGKGHENMMANKAIVVVAVEVHRWHGESHPGDGHGTGRRREGKPVWHTRAGRCRMRVVPDRTAKTIYEFVRDNIDKGASIWTDDAAAYNLTASRGYPRRITVAKEDGDPLPTLGRVVTNLKRWLLGTHKGSVSPDHLQAYLNEYVFRFNRRDMPWVAFNRALGLAVLDRPAAEYEALYKHTWRHPNPSEGPEQIALGWGWDEL